MNKIKCASIFFLLFSGNVFPVENNEAEIFKKVFGTKKDFRYIALPFFFKDKYLGEVNVGIENNLVVNYSGASLIQALKLILSDTEVKRLINLKKEKFETSDFNFKIEYVSSELKLELIAPDSLIKPNESLFQEDLIPYFAADAIKPSPFGGAINWKILNSISEKDSRPSFFGLNTDSFINYRGFVLENQIDYSSEKTPYWNRTQTTLIKDDEKNLIRYSVGDITNNNVGYLVTRNLGGISIDRDFDINPYRISSPTTNTEFTIDSRSLVKYYINGAMVKSEYLNSGKYSVKNIPLNNGINNVVVEVESESGDKKIFNFKETFSTELLNKDDYKFDFSAGYLSEDINSKKNYETSKGMATSGYYKRGWTNNFTNSIYLQNRSKYNLFGSENILSSKFGNWSVGVSNSRNVGYSGNAAYFGYSLSAFSSFLSNSQSFSLRVEKRDKEFSDSFDFNFSRFKWNLNSSYTLPLSDIASLGLGLQYSKPYDLSLFEKFGTDLSLTGRIYKSATITLFSSLIRDEFKSWNQYYYLFLNISFPESATYVSSYYESQSQTKKISLYHDKGDVINSLKVQGAIEDTRYSEDGNLDLQYNSKYADIGLSQQVKKVNRNISGRSEFRLLSSVLFASNGEGLNIGLSRPVSTSFALFSQKGEIKNQLLKVQATEGSLAQTETGSGGKLVVNDLNPYQYRRIQIDKSNLKDGYNLKKESYIVYPTYKSAHLIDVISLGSVSLKGKIIDKTGKPIALEVGYIKLESGEDIPFFTNKVGKFFVESIKPGKLKLIFGNSQYAETEIFIQKELVGMVDVKEIKIEDK